MNACKYVYMYVHNMQTLFKAFACQPPCMRVIHTCIQTYIQPHLHSMNNTLSKPQRQTLFAALHRTGYEASISHTSGTAIKTSAPLSLLFRIAAVWAARQHAPRCCSSFVGLLRLHCCNHLCLYRSCTKVLLCFLASLRLHCCSNFRVSYA